MNKKKITIVVILFLVATSVAPITAQEIGETTQSSPLSNLKTNRSPSLFLTRGFGLESVITIQWSANDTQKPLEPGGAPRSVNFTVTYCTVSSYYLIGQIIGKIILLYCIFTHQNVTVRLELGDFPSWCTASLSDSEIQFPVNDEISTQNISLTVAVDEHAPAYAVCAIPVHVEVDMLRGPIGLLPFVNGCNQTATIHFFPGYLPHIIVEPESEYMDVIPGYTTHLSINITNHGNARTTVFAEIVDRPGNDWNVLVTDEIMVEVNMSNFAYLLVRPPDDFYGTDTITISFTPYKSDDHSQYGEPVNITITVIYEPED